MDSGSVTCLSTVMVLFSALMIYLTRRRVEKRLREQQMRTRIALNQDAEKRHGAMLEVLKWVHKVHQAVYFAEIAAQRVLPEKPDNSGWEDVASRLDALGPCPPESGILPESLRSLVFCIEPDLAEIKRCVARHKGSLDLISYDTPSVHMLSESELGVARKVLAEEIEEKSQNLNLFIETVEKHFDAAFFAPLDVRLHKGRYDSPTASGAGSRPKGQ